LLIKSEQRGKLMRRLGRWNSVSCVADLVAEIQVWRAATQVEQADLRPPGPMQSSLLARTWQLRLDKQLVAADIAQDQQWTNRLVKRIPNVIKDSFMPSLVNRLERLDRAGFDAANLVRSAAAKGCRTR
jgi:hypothetical protein